jgi:leucyl aminopeptidase
LIEEEQMGGLLAVNQGSQEPPTFTVLEWMPDNRRNERPVVLVGKGVTFDTGGLSLKPTKDSMDAMKSDMAGAAAVIGAVEAVARMELPLYVIGLIPATDNRPGENAYVPGDVIKMHSGKTVEVLNTDAEGRMILADALSYAKTYNPEVVIDLATLTGAAVVALGNLAAAVMTSEGPGAAELIAPLVDAGVRTGERVHELPMYAGYGEQIKSDVADIKNVGGRGAGSITAAKFLEHFVSYPWIHMDIAGPSYLKAAKPYRTIGGTGFGVRILVDYLRDYADRKRG